MPYPFAEAVGKLAKTDRADAAMHAKMGAVLSLEAETPCDQKLYDLKELLVARRALIKDQTAARSRMRICCRPSSNADRRTDETDRKSPGRAAESHSRSDSRR